MEKRHVYVLAEVLRAQEGVLTVRLEDGFAQAEVVVHEDVVVNTAIDISAHLHATL